MANLWEEKFSQEGYLYGEEPNEFIREQAWRLEGRKRIVAFAEGEGRNAVFLARQGHDVTAWDYTQSLDKTKQLAERHQVRVETGQKDLIHDSVPSEEYDASIMVFGHFLKEDQKTVFDKLVSVVKPGGIVMLEVYSEDQLSYGTGGPKSVDMVYHPADILQWIQGYKVLHFFYGEQGRVEGKGHTGTGHVIQVILQK
ncbi:class I SAM-dependent methyltransferase [Cytobacillus firmus]|uniref:class I SAM-dependent methyltransferase n=1 Tax=Cytobacillus firmus TaxID=1399 RepID=UPI001CFD5905|nr:class I SAM-dependent methyltransferase [Cytobacillus firmus]